MPQLLKCWICSKIEFALFKCVFRNEDLDIEFKKTLKDKLRRKKEKKKIPSPRSPLCRSPHRRHEPTHRHKKPLRLTAHETPRCPGDPADRSPVATRLHRRQTSPTDGRGDARSHTPSAAGLLLLSARLFSTCLSALLYRGRPKAVSISRSRGSTRPACVPVPDLAHPATRRHLRQAR